MREYIIYIIQINEKWKKKRFEHTECLCEALIRLNHHQKPHLNAGQALEREICHHKPEFNRILYTFMYRKYKY